MERTIIPTDNNRLETVSHPALQALVSKSEDDFYGSLQRIWNNVVQLEDMGIIQQENDKFVYAYRFAEIELQRAFAGQTPTDLNVQTY